MTTELDADLVPEVATLINDELGTDAVFKVLTAGGVYQLPGSNISAPTYSDVTVKITPPSPFGAFLIDGDIIQSGDMKTLIAAQGITFTPVVEQRVVFASQSWRIVSVGPIYSGDLVCAYGLQLRRGP